MSQNRIMNNNKIRLINYIWKIMILVQIMNKLSKIFKNKLKIIIKLKWNLIN